MGEARQARLASASVDLPLDGAAAEIAARYLAGAGVGRLRVKDGRAGAAAGAVDPAVVIEVVPDLSCRGPSPSECTADLSADLDLALEPAVDDVARGALFALAALRDLLGVGPVS